MAKAPWFPFYTGDFLASPDVQDMEAHEIGAYVLLLARSWQSDTPGYIEDDDYGLRRAARLTAEVWAQCKRALLKKWPLAEDMPGYRYNPRLKKEAEKQVELREIKAEAGRKSAERRARMATEGQQSGNTIATPVEIPATGVGEKGNYSQSQSQPQSQEDKSSSSLRSEDAAPAAASEPEKKIEGEPAVESPAPPQTPPPVAKPPRFQPPTQEMVLAYFQQQRPYNPLAALSQLADRWHSHYTANGWKVGKNPMKDWQAACRTWLSDVPRLEAATGPAVILPVQQFNYATQRQQPVSQVTTRQAAIAGADAMFDAVAAGRDPFSS